MEADLLGSIGAVLLTHLHPDHWADLFALRNALLNSGTDKKVDLHVGPGNEEVLARICDTMAIGRGYFSDFFNLHEYEPGINTTILSFEVSFFRTRHSADTHGLKIRHQQGPAIIFAADTGPYPQLPQDLQGAQLVILECNTEERAEGDAVHMCVEDLLVLLGKLPDCKSVCISHYPLGARERIQSRLSDAFPKISVHMATTGLELGV
ncbi:MBL fold metallo-hydrolase (plasmid) [Allorhizobium sp. Av2]